MTTHEVEGLYPRRWLFPLFAVLLSTVVATPLLELVLRIEYAVRQRYRPSLSLVHEALGWVPTPDLTTGYFDKHYGEVDYSTDGAGFRRFGDPDATFNKIWAVGDSTTQAYQVSDGEAYYDVLARLDPEIELFAYGAGGYGTLQEAMVLERFWDRIDPDVVLWQMCANDLINNDWELESLSNEHNNHMARPYLIDGQIEMRHPDRGLGWLAQRSLVARRLAVLRTSLRKRLRGSIEAELYPDHPAVRRTVATTRETIVTVIERHAETSFLAFFVPSPERYAWERDAWTEICELPGLECLPQVDAALEAARRQGISVDGGEDPHWNAAGHEIAARAILERIRQLR